MYAQVDDLGVRFIRIQQDKVHQQMLQGTAGNPWQYRILADLMLEPLIRLYARMGFAGPETLAFLSFRYVQCLLILAAAALYYRKMGLGLTASLLGLSILTWSLSSSLYDSDLSFNVFFDVAFYLVAGWLILQRRMTIVALLMIPAALNRETSLLIPMMLAAVVYFERAPNTGPQRAHDDCGSRPRHLCNRVCRTPSILRQAGILDRGWLLPRSAIAVAEHPKGDNMGTTAGNARHCSDPGSTDVRPLAQDAAHLLLGYRADLGGGTLCSGAGRRDTPDARTAGAGVHTWSVVRHCGRAQATQLLMMPGFVPLCSKWNSCLFGNGRVPA